MRFKDLLNDIIDSLLPSRRKEMRDLLAKYDAHRLRIQQRINDNRRGVYQPADSKQNADRMAAFEARTKPQRGDIPQPGASPRVIKTLKKKTK